MNCSETLDQPGRGLPHCCLGGFSRFCIHRQCWFPPTHQLQKLCVQTQTQCVRIDANACITQDCVRVTDNRQCVYLRHLSKARSIALESTETPWAVLFYIRLHSANHPYNMSLNASVSRDQCHRFGKLLVMKKEHAGGQNVDASWRGDGVLFSTGSSPMFSSLFTFFRSARIRKFPLLGSPAHLWSISGRSDLKHALPEGKIHYPGLQGWPGQSLPQAAHGLRQQESAWTSCRNILHDQNTTISTFVKLQG